MRTKDEKESLLVVKWGISEIKNVARWQAESSATAIDGSPG